MRIHEPSRSDEAGFSLIEVIVAMMVLVVAMTGVTALFASSFKQITVARSDRPQRR
jgi:prepilin-type N-terminal cleavage/methylation domain-containing protein